MIQDLKPYNTFGVSAKAEIAILKSIEDLRIFLLDAPNGLILGKGSNVLFTEDVRVPVGIVSWKGVRQEPLSPGHSLLIAAAGESWAELVRYSVKQKLGGLENLALIPGSVGAAPVQNIGAYGMEQERYFQYALAMDRSSLEIRKFTHADCKFGYRTSIFKEDDKDRYVILEVAYALKTKSYDLELSYSPLSSYFEQHSLLEVNPETIAQAVTEIRQSKLPDPSVLGNAGSFFKNPILSTPEMEAFSKKHPGVPIYAFEGQHKIAAGWLIDQAGLKGAKIGGASVHMKQALVIINEGNASGKDVEALAHHIQNKIYEIYGIRLEPEVSIL